MTRLLHDLCLAMQTYGDASKLWWRTADECVAEVCDGCSVQVTHTRTSVEE